MSRASRKMSASGLRRWTKQEEIKKSTNSSSLNCSNPMRIQFASLVVYRCDPQSVLRLEIADQLDHLRIRLRLREHEFPELITRERALLVEDRPAQVFLQRQFAHFVGIKGQVMPVFHLVQVQIERLGSQCPGLMAPAVGKQHATDIQKQRRNRGRSFHLTFTFAKVSISLSNG